MMYCTLSGANRSGTRECIAVSDEDGWYCWCHLLYVNILNFFFFFICFWQTSGSFFIVFSSVAAHRGQPAAKCHPRWQPTRKLAVSCGLGRRWIRTQDCRTTVRRATTEPPCLPYHGATMPPNHWATMPWSVTWSVGCERVGEVAKGGQLLANQGQEWMGICAPSKEDGSPRK
jgi:hypothetical protein